MHRRGVVRAGKGNTLVKSNEYRDDTNRIIKSLKNLGALIDEVSKTINHEIKGKEGGFLGMLLWTLSTSILGNMLTRKGVERVSKRSNNMDHMGKNL